MSDLEHAASRVLKPMFDEKIALSLSADNLALVARWCMKTALMIQFIEDTRAIPEQYYADFYRLRTPPARSLGFVARHDGNWSNGSNSILYSVKSGGSEDGQMYGTTFFIKNLVVQIIGVDWDAGLHLNLPREFAGHVQPLWPERRPVIWPPRIALDDQGVYNFARSLLDLQAA